MKETRGRKIAYQVHFYGHEKHFVWQKGESGKWTRKYLVGDESSIRRQAAEFWGIEEALVIMPDDPENTSTVPIEIGVRRPLDEINRQIELLENRRDNIDETIQELLLERQGAIISPEYRYCCACGISVVKNPHRVCSRCNPSKD